MKVFNTGETDKSLKNKYNPEGSDLRRGQLIMLDMLKYIDDLCKKHGIEYRLDSGNVLGAVRHGGFIPWDDDVDIALFRKDYYKLYHVLKHERHERFTLQDIYTDSNFYLHLIKLRDRNSHMHSKDNTRDKLQFDGFQIDIFRMIKGPISFFIRVDCWIANHIENKLRMSNRFLWRCIYQFMEIVVYPFFRFCSLLFGDKHRIGYDYGMRFYENFSFDSCYPYKPICFENTMFMGPSNPVVYCKELYGDDYDELPPLEKRNQHDVDDYLFE